MGKKRIIIVSIFILVFIFCIIGTMFYYDDKYSVSFETGTDDELLIKYVKRNGKVSEPTTPKKEGFVFKEWQLNGKKYDFNEEVNKDTVLTAKWIKEEYVIVNFDTGSTYEIEPKKLLEGEKLNDLPNVEKEGYEFIGWYLGDKIYKNEEIYDDITLVAKFNKINNIKKGDKVKIIGNYSNSAYSLSSNYNVAIGWERSVLDIIENSNYPYMVGNSMGVTGFFSEESLELLD